MEKQALWRLCNLLTPKMPTRSQFIQRLALGLNQEIVACMRACSVDAIRDWASPFPFLLVYVLPFSSPIHQRPIQLCWSDRQGKHGIPFWRQFGTIPGFTIPVTETSFLQHDQTLRSSWTNACVLSTSTGILMTQPCNIATRISLIRYSYNSQRCLFQHKTLHSVPCYRAAATK